MPTDSRLLADVILEDNPKRLTSFRALPLGDSIAREAFALGLYLKSSYDHELSNAIRDSKDRMSKYVAPFALAIATFISNVESYRNAEFLVSVPARTGEPDRLSDVFKGLAAFDLGDVDIDGGALVLSPKAPKLRRLGAAARREGIKGMFRSKYNYYEGGKAVLIDDVHTSGSTTDEATRTLLKAGIDEVLVLVITKTAYNESKGAHATDFPCKSFRSMAGPPSRAR